MANITREELDNLLNEIKKDKEKGSNYKAIQPAMAMCYSTSFFSDNREVYIGKHICNNCHKTFGENLTELIENCRREKYIFYVKDDGKFKESQFCYGHFLWHNLQNDETALNFLKQHHLELIKTSEGEYCFNRLLNYDEWCEITNTCYSEYYVPVDSDVTPEDVKANKKVSSHCFKYNPNYKTFEDVAQKYIDNGFDVQLKYNCEECADEHNEIEFWFRLKGQKDYVISYPAVISSSPYIRNLRRCRYVDYISVLEFLKGNTSYAKIKQYCAYEAQWTSLKWWDIDCAISLVTGEDIIYAKDDVIMLVGKGQALNFNQIYDHYGDDFKMSAYTFKNIMNVCKYFSNPLNFSEIEKIINGD